MFENHSKTFQFDLCMDQFAWAKYKRLPLENKKGNSNFLVLNDWHLSYFLILNIETKPW